MFLDPNPMLDPLRDDPPMAELIQRVGLPGRAPAECLAP